MKRFTQSSLTPGNCWQTAIACLLEVDPETLPSQVDIETADKNGYSNALNKYLRKHHGLFQAWIHFPSFLGVVPRSPGYHLMAGPTVRTPKNNVHHIVVGQDGAMVWDPHPARSGLTDVTSWVVLVEAPGSWAESWDRLACVCPACLAATG